MSGYSTIDHPALVRALAHPLRARVLGLLQERQASPSELAGELEAPLGNVSYHVRILADLDLIKLVKKTPRRGAIEHHYEAVSAARVTDRRWGDVPGIAKQALAAASIDDVGRAVTEAAASGGFERADAELRRTRIELDEQGWHDLAEEVVRVQARAGEIEKESRGRLRRSDDGVIDGSLVMMLFERAPGAESSAVPAAR